MGALDGKVAIITGAGSGIGRASALRFAAEGAKLVIGDKTEAVHETARLVKDAGGEVVALEVDAGVEADVASLVAAAKESFGGLDVAFANAGIIGDMGGIFDFDPAAWAETLRVNLIGPALMVKHAGKAMVDQGRGGAIVLTASVAGINSGAGPGAYSASKAGVINLAKVAAQQLSTSGVRVGTTGRTCSRTPTSTTRSCDRRSPPSRAAIASVASSCCGRCWGRRPSSSRPPPRPSAPSSSSASPASPPAAPAPGRRCGIPPATSRAASPGPSATPPPTRSWAVPPRS